jgi:hypothetical protein
MRNNATPVLQSKSGYFPNGLTIDGVRWEGEFYLLSSEAYEALLVR